MPSQTTESLGNPGRFKAWAESIPGKWSEEFDLAWDADAAISTLVFESQLAKSLNRRKNICFITPEEKIAEGEFRIFKTPDLALAIRSLAKNNFDPETTFIWHGGRWTSVSDLNASAAELAGAVQA